MSSTKFLVKNIALDKKTLHFFLYPIRFGEVRDLMLIPGVSESDIRNSLLKEDLSRKLRYKEIEIVFSNIELIQCDETQREFLLANKIAVGGNSVSLCCLTNIAELQALPTTNLMTGCKSFIQTLRDFFILDEGSSDTIDGITVIPALNGGRWKRILEPSVSWLEQVNCYVKSSIGNDENPGTLTLPLKTIAEFQRRYIVLLNKSQQIRNITLYLLEDCIEDCFWNVFFNAHTFLTIDGSLGKTLITTQTVTSVTLANQGSKIKQSIHVNGFNWATHVPAGSNLGEIGIIISGTHPGAVFTPTIDMTGGTVQTGIFGAADEDATPVTIAPGDVFGLYQMPKILGNFNVSGAGIIRVTQCSLGSTNNLHQVSFTLPVAGVDLCQLYDIDAVQCGQFFITNCVFRGAPRCVSNSDMFIWGGSGNGSCVPIVNYGGTIHLTDFHIMNGKLREPTSEGTYSIESGALVIWDTTNGGSPITIGNSSILTSIYDGIIWGTGNVNVAPQITLKPGAKAFYKSGSPPDFTGAGQQLDIGGTSKNFSDLPVPPVVANGAMYVIG